MVYDANRRCRQRRPPQYVAEMIRTRASVEKQTYLYRVGGLSLSDYYRPSATSAKATGQSCANVSKSQFADTLRDKLIFVHVINYKIHNSLATAHTQRPKGKRKHQPPPDYLSPEHGRLVYIFLPRLFFQHLEWFMVMFRFDFLSTVIKNIVLKY